MAGQGQPRRSKGSCQTRQRSIQGTCRQLTGARVKPDSPKKPRAIDLYSGVGGWSLGLTLAGVEVVASYEMWGAANETNFKNNGHQAQTVDIRRLALTDLPTDINFVVGSPPCTQFSFSNRGGSGDIADGLQDIICFLRIVDHLRPQVWAMENVPRVAKIIMAELEPGGALSEFRHLGCVPHVVDMADFGLPQRRRRCIAGNFDFELLQSYRAGLPRQTLGDVVTALSSEPVVDPLFGIQLTRDELIDHVVEDLLSDEEERINRASKTTHPIYNAMPFPDPLDRTVRTITATCTRVSRESIVIEAPSHPISLRRLTLRERASLQGFPITFQFYGRSFGQKLRMIGNAFPPVFAYFMGKSLQAAPRHDIALLDRVGSTLKRPAPVPLETPPDRMGAKYPVDRNFKFAIPSLQLKSGVRFEFANSFDGDVVRWRIAFYFGTSKMIQSISLDRELGESLKGQMSDDAREVVTPQLIQLEQTISAADIANMQGLWAHRGPGGTRAFMVLDELDRIGAMIAGALDDHRAEAACLIERTIEREFGPDGSAIGVAKLVRNAPRILAGLLVATTVNPIFDEHSRRDPGRERRRSPVV